MFINVFNKTSFDMMNFEKTENSEIKVRKIIASLFFHLSFISKTSCNFVSNITVFIRILKDVKNISQNFLLS